MNKSKLVDELTIEDLKQNPIWEWAIDEEENEEYDETWVKPVETINFTEELNGSIVLGELIIHNDEKFPMMCSIENNEVLISSIVFYNEKENEYIAIEDVVKKIEMLISININIKINRIPRFLKFSADKIYIYKNIIKTNLI
ncbi:hypothetical protein AB2553_16955 [Bacillus mycoides]|uniref:hypothetical protein n=1 Tax=Bacillus mycoides TaxID=1405 RepID=UPI003463852C